MINLQNPSIPVQANPIEIDRAIVDLQTKLSDNITWLTHGYGRAYKNLDLTQNRTVFYPEVYLGTQNNSQRYTNISPDNDKTGQCFFLVTQELVNEFQQGQYAYLEYDVAIIFSVNLELINSVLLATDYFLQNCVAEVRNCLTRIPTGAPYQLVINDAQFLFEDVFAEFDLNDAQVLEKAPLTHFRLNTTITLQEECIDFAPEPTNITSFDLDGVNEYIDTIFTPLYARDKDLPFSFSVWCKLDTLTGNRSIIDKYNNPSSKGVELMLHSTVIRFGLNGGPVFSSGIFVKTNNSPPINTWFLLTTTYDGSVNTTGLKIYFDGVLQSTFNEAFNNGFTNSILEPNKTYTIGLKSGLPTYSGLINSVRIWDVELSSGDVLTEYNSGAVNFPPVNSSNLILEMLPDNSTWNGSSFDIDDLTGITAGYSSINMEEVNKVNDAP
jgi:hypothetical protein